MKDLSRIERWIRLDWVELSWEDRKYVREGLGFGFGFIKNWRIWKVLEFWIWDLDL
jgi:hypothetical protein